MHMHELKALSAQHQSAQHQHPAAPFPNVRPGPIRHKACTRQGTSIDMQPADHNRAEVDGQMITDRWPDGQQQVARRPDTGGQTTTDRQQQVARRPQTDSNRWPDDQYRWPNDQAADNHRFNGERMPGRDICANIYQARVAESKSYH